ncbi:MerR family transcriptional regulator [Ruminococcus gauvreauii]|uniref:MerR family transcriptional regulator n=1 Tax=Ruminococcus gauvreauii TaxID=438033 RepID=A0ABY5VKR3_9FIRM|nr:MerR family transcriptional regulator [Ruminococcus gauvreauii]UWP60892.1 MerR family transcriptional regulator [Ruminococcus gauvreauii]
MKTVKEVAKLTGISVRTLHYYDEIGLLKPTQTSEAGYRLYDDKALEVLQQILFFREFDMPLGDIKSIMEDPELDRDQLLNSQREMLVLKKERLERIIASIDGILKGDHKMDFEVFSKTDIEEMYSTMVKNMSEEQKDIFVRQYGSMEGFQKHFMEQASGEQAQKNFAKVVEWYGDKDSALKAAENPDNPKIMEAYGQRLENITKKLAAKSGTDVNSFEVREIAGEMDFVSRQLYQMKDVSAFMLDMARKYQTDREFQMRMDEIYGAGATEYIGRALEAFYNR